MSLSVKNSCGGKSLPELTSPASAFDIASGKQAIDRDGNIVEGNLYQLLEGRQWIVNGTKLESNGTEMITSYGTLDGDFIFRNGSVIGTSFESSELGNATAADVASGKIFTSSSGLNVTGTGVLVKTGMASIISNKILTIPETGLTEFILYSENMITAPTPTNTVPILIYRNLGEEHIRICYKYDYYNSMSANRFIEYSGTTNKRVSVIDNGTNTTITLDSSFTAKFNVAMRYIGF